MHNAVLVVNCGSSSIKYALIGNDQNANIKGIAENLGSQNARIIHQDGAQKSTQNLPECDHQLAISTILELLGDNQPVAIGHRVVHGGEDFTQAALIDQSVIDAISKNIPLAPLHNPTHLIGIRATLKTFAHLPQVAVFDTAFHQTMPPRAYHYAISQHYYRQHAIRRYGFHGTSHAYVSSVADQLYPNQDNGWLCAHLGNGCSTAAVFAGKSMDTSMGMTPLEGVVMGTRSGDIDAGILIHLQRSLNMSVDEIETLLNKQSGLLGLSGSSADMRVLEQKAAQGDQDAQLAIEVFCYRVAKSLAALSCALPILSGVIFTGGIGENGAQVRARICDFLAHLGAFYDAKRNQTLSGGNNGNFANDDARIHLLVIATNEERRIAIETRALLQL